MTLLRRERDSNRRSLSSGSARASLAAGGNGIRTVSPSPVRVGLFAACGKFAAWLDLFMTPWWREVDSNPRSLSLDSPGGEGAGGRSGWSRKTPSLFTGGPAVRIPFAPAESPVGTPKLGRCSVGEMLWGG